MDVSLLVAACDVNVAPERWHAVAARSRSAQERQVETLLACAVDRDLVAGVRVTHDPGSRIVPEHALDPARGGGRAVADDHHTRVLRIADAHTAAVVDRYPGRAARGVQERVEHRPVGDRVGAVAHRFGLAVGARDRAGVEMISADYDRRLELAARDHLVEREPEPLALAETHPADARRQPL